MAILTYVVAKRDTGKAMGTFSSHASAMAWMDTQGYYWPEYTVQTWVLDNPDDGYEEWI